MAKAKATRKPPAKKRPAKKAKPKKTVASKSTKSVKAKHELIVRVEQTAVVPTTQDLAEPISEDGKKLTIPKTWMDQKQIMFLVQHTPREHVYKRPAKGGGTWEYVTGAYVEKVLNYVFGWNWDFDVLEHGREDEVVWVKGKLTVRGAQGQEISKTQFGRAEIKYRKGAKKMLDYGNDLKAAATDSLKKCASLLGIASDIYGKSEYKRETGLEVKDRAPVKATTSTSKAQPVSTQKTMKPGQVAGPDGEPVYVCESCAVVVDDQVAEYSMRIYKKPLCRECQKTCKPKK